MKQVMQVLVIFAIFIFSMSAVAATYTVCSSGCNYTTLSAAASGVPSGANHTISVAAGTYSGFTDTRSGPGSTAEVDSSYRIWYANGTVNVTSQITIQGNWVKLDGFTMDYSGSGIALWTGSAGGDMGSNCWFTNLTISGMREGITITGVNNRITDNDLSDIKEDYFRVFGSGHLYRGNYIHNHLESGATYHSDVWQTYNSGNGSAQDITIEKNHVFLGEDATGELTDQPSGTLHVIMWEDTGGRKASGLTVRNNIFEATGWFNSGAARPDGLRIYNNLWRADDDIREQTQIGVAPTGNATDDVEIRNNLLIDKSEGIRIGANVTNITNSNNLFWRNDGGGVSNINYSSTGDITGQDPLFTIYDNNTYNLTDAYKLQSASPARDAGATIASFSTDYEETARPHGASWDIGAYEFEATASPARTITGLNCSGCSWRY